MDNIILRSARLDELEAIIALLADDALGARRESVASPAAACYVAAFEAIAADANCQLLQLTTDKGRPDAHRFYEKLGFVASHEGYKLAL